MKQSRYLHHYLLHGLLCDANQLTKAIRGIIGPEGCSGAKIPFSDA
jgi:hypothetical protein